MNPKIAFFGTPDIAVASLDALHAAGCTPALIVTNPDRPSGRGRTLTSPPAKVWAAAHDVPVRQPTSARDASFVQDLAADPWDLFVVVAYGGMLPKTLLNIPKHGTLNVHPSLLPEFRGPSPIRSAILADRRDTGVTIMQMDEELDHGPIVAQAHAGIAPDEWPMRGRELDRRLAALGGDLLARTIPPYLAGEITPREQDHANATYTKKLTKDMGELSIDPYDLPTGNDAYHTILTIYALDGWPGTYFFHNSTRIKIADATLDEHGALCITRIIPEGKQEMDFTAYFRG